MILGFRIYQLPLQDGCSNHIQAAAPLRELSARSDIAVSTLRDRYHGTHAPRVQHTTRNLSIIHEDAPLDTTNAYANRGTFLTPNTHHSACQASL